MKLIKGVMAAILALLPLEAMAEDTIKIRLVQSRRGDHRRRRQRFSQTRKHPSGNQHGDRFAHAVAQSDPRSI